MIKLIASDIDGTLVPEGGHVLNSAYYDVIQDLKEEGITFCACSGRHYHSMQELFAPVAEDIYFIASNGTMLRTKDRILHTWKLEPPVYFALLERLRAIEGTEIVVEGPDACWVEGIDTPATRLLREEYHYSVENVPDLAALPVDNIIKVTLYHPDRIEEVTKGLDQFPEAEHLAMAISGAVWMDITAKGAGKGAAFALLQEYLGIGIEETVYFGDNLNDLPAFREAGIAATVANARAELHEAADIVERSYAELGVLRELFHILNRARQYRGRGE